ncbi:MAG: DUF4169 family protein [Pseudochelatococcus sp.]|jgi:hypothetical protein|uniref:DUF4169 family protein n=1 Tax=Pseudochelatococcus sp. TaxID=2020869 RepID=UPI003D925AAF
MAEIVNLRRARKARARSEKEAQAAENRLRFGATKAERTASAAAREKDERHLDAHRLPEENGGDTDGGKV